MKKYIIVFLISLLLVGCDKNEAQAEAPYSDLVGIQEAIEPVRNEGPQDIFCYSGTSVTYNHQNVILYMGISRSSTIVDVYEIDTKEKVIVSLPCIIRPHKD